jgi:hypothetical protein
MIDLHDVAGSEEGFEFIVTEQALQVAALVTKRFSLDKLQASDRCLFDLKTTHASA